MRLIRNTKEQMTILNHISCAVSCWVGLYCVVSSRVVSCRVVSCHIMSCYVMLCYVTYAVQHFVPRIVYDFTYHHLLRFSRIYRNHLEILCYSCWITCCYCIFVANSSINRAFFQSYNLFCCRTVTVNMMMSSNRNILRVIGPLCGEFTGHRWIPRIKASDAELWCFFFYLCLNKRLSKQSWGWWFETPSCSLWRHCNAYGFLELGDNSANFNIIIWCLFCDNDIVCSVFL